MESAPQVSVEERPQGVKLGVVQGEVSLDTPEAPGEPSGAARTAQAAAGRPPSSPGCRRPLAWAWGMHFLLAEGEGEGESSGCQAKPSAPGAHVAHARLCVASCWCFEAEAIPTVTHTTSLDLSCWLLQS